MQKIRNFGSLSKNITKLTKKKPTKPSDSAATTPPQKYENTQFYVDSTYQNVDPKTNKVKKMLMTTLRSPKTRLPEDPYQNTEFHQPVAPAANESLPPPPSSPAAPSSLNVSSDLSTATSPASAPTTFARKKSKSGKSFDSKFRKSLGPLSNGAGSLALAFNKTRSTFYVSDSVDIDSGVFTGTPSELPVDAADNSGAGGMPTMIVRPAPPVPTGAQPTVSQRKSSLTVRPNNPPPPPPPPTTIPVDKRASKGKRRNTTSWYTECGLFKLTAALPTDDASQQKVVVENDAVPKVVVIVDDDGDVSSTTKKDPTLPANDSSWYADVGLYQTSGASVASSSGSSGVSTGGECGGSGDDNSHSMFLNEPLYQIYSAAKLEVSFFLCGKGG